MNIVETLQFCSECGDPFRGPERMEKCPQCAEEERQELRHAHKILSSVPEESEET